MTARARSHLDVVARLLIAIFCWFTAAYAFVASSAFAYLQFLKPRVIESVARAGELHRFAAWVWLAFLVVVTGTDRRNGRASRWSSLLLVACGSAAVAWNTVHPVLPNLVPGAGAVFAGCLALTPLLWLSAIDHVVAGSALRLFDRGPAVGEDRHAPAGDEPSRLFRAAAGATVLCTAVYALLTSIGVSRNFEPDLTIGALELGLLWSSIEHALLFSTVFLVVVATLAAARLARRSLAVEYTALSLLLTATFGAAFVKFVAIPIGLEQPQASLAGAASAASLVATWAGLSVRAFGSRRGRAEADVNARPARLSAVDIFAPAPVASPSRLLAAGSVAIAAAAIAGAWISDVADWNFLLLNCGIVGVWTASMVLMARVAPPRHVRTRALAVGCAAPLLLHVALGGAATATHAFERFGVYNPSFRFARQLLDPAPPEPRFNRLLRAYAELTDVPVEPISIDFVAPLEPRRPPLPDVFLFVVDSLRPDYLSAYNRAVTFTPNIARFASESLTFRNAFTRFGATGLSVPAIWAGAALPHKQYVLPFTPMNALMKLLQANGYLRLMAMDSVVAQLLPRDADLIELERGVPVMDYDLCRTLDELGEKVSAAAGGRPLFAYALPQNLHMSHVRSRPVPAGERYDGFVAPLAAEVHRLDRCFGSFIDDLKRQRRYDNSVIVLTADHGDSLGEDGRWGHSYTLVPEVVSVPLIVHLPAALAGDAAVDVDAVALSTDITPTIYAALGYHPLAIDGLAGRPLIRQSEAAAVQRRRETHVLASSYGAVYAALGQNGTRLYIADAINNTESAYARRLGGSWSAQPVDAGERMISRMEIRRHLDDLARAYHLSRAF